MHAMTAWAEISLQSEWWVPLAAWAKWVDTRNLDTLQPGERIAVVDMSPDHRVKAATLLVSHARTSVLRLEPRVETRLAAIAKTNLDPSAQLLLPIVDHIEHRTAIATALFAATPLCSALLDQAPLVHPLVTAEFIEDLSAQGMTPHGLLLQDLVSANDARASMALRLIARQAVGQHRTLLLSLLADGVLLHDALSVHLQVQPL